MSPLVDFLLTLAVMAAWLAGAIGIICGIVWVCLLVLDRMNSRKARYYRQRLREGRLHG